MRVLGINAVFHDPAAAVAIDGKVVAAAEEERFSRRKHGKRPVPFSTWELPELAARWCLAESAIGAGDLDAIAYSYDAALVRPGQEGLDRGWEALRTRYADRAPEFLATALPGLDPAKVTKVAHHVAHAASAGLAAPFGDCAVLVLDGRGEAASHLAGVYAGGELTILASQELPHSLGLMYEDVTNHLGFLRSSDEHKVVLASYGKPRFTGERADRIRVSGDGGFVDLLPAFAAAAPVDVFGMQAAGLPQRLGVDPASIWVFDDLPQRKMHAGLARRRVYLHPFRWTSLGLSLIEAMMLGMPVVALATTEAVQAVPPEAGVVSSRLDVLADAIQGFVNDPLRSRRAGQAARSAALDRYSLARFQRDWDRALREVTR